MGDENQLMFVREHLDLVASPVLEVGSRNYGNTPDFRTLLPGRDYVGLDLSEGAGVDVVCDLAADIEVLREALGGRSFGTIICFSVLEHCRDLFTVSRNIAALLRPGGSLFVSVPFSWRVHGYPSDYWRFTPEGVRALFPCVEFSGYPGSITTTRPGETAPITKRMLRLPLHDAPRPGAPRRYGAVTQRLIWLCSKVGLMRPWFDYPYLFPPVMINMAGVKASEPAER